MAENRRQHYNVNLISDYKFVDAKLKDIKSDLDFFKDDGNDIGRQEILDYILYNEVFKQKSDDFIIYKLAIDNYPYKLIMNYFKDSIKSYDTFKKRALLLKKKVQNYHNEHGFEIAYKKLMDIRFDLRMIKKDENQELYIFEKQEEEGNEENQK